MKRIFMLIMSLCLLFAFTALAQSAGVPVSPVAPAALPVVTTSTTGMVATVLAIVGLAVPIMNVLMSAITQIFVILHKSEPGWLQKLGMIGMTISKWVTANTSTPPPKA